jgi:hypothetical protein
VRRSRSIRGLAPVLIALAGLPWAATAREHLAPPAPGTIRLLQPAAGAILQAGGRATLEWTAGTLSAGVEEWEAFLSLDGGATYPYRITPHLSIGLRRFDFHVPELRTEQMALLLRLGDERSETEHPLAARFSIRGDSPVLEVEIPIVSALPGEAVRAGSTPTFAWVEGRRDGTGQRAVSAIGPSMSALPPLRFESAARATDGEAMPDPTPQLTRKLQPPIGSLTTSTFVLPAERPLPAVSSSTRLSKLSRRNQ